MPEKRKDAHKLLKLLREKSPYQDLKWQQHQGTSDQHLVNPLYRPIARLAAEAELILLCEAIKEIEALKPILVISLDFAWTQGIGGLRRLQPCTSAKAS
ncbi:hypothetical protein L1887_15188 [Cichorium endivia]|nr:hypothetical protein L1887_15188 [Cichorium endivia]